MSEIEVKNVPNEKQPQDSLSLDSPNNHDKLDKSNSLPKLKILLRERKPKLDDSMADQRWTSPRVSKQRSAQKSSSSFGNNQSYNHLKSVINEKVLKKFKESTQKSLLDLLPQAEFQANEEIESVIRQVKVSVSKLQPSSVNNVFLNKAIHDFDMDSIKDILIPPSKTNSSPSKSAEKKVKDTSPQSSQPNYKKTRPISPTKSSVRIKKRVMSGDTSDEDYIPLNDRKRRNVLEDKRNDEIKSVKNREDVMIVNNPQNTTIMPPPRQTKILSTMREKLRAKRLQKDAERGSNLRVSDLNSAPNSASETTSPNDIFFTPNNTPNMINSTQLTPNSQQGFQDEFNKFASSTSSLSPLSNGADNLLNSKEFEDIPPPTCEQIARVEQIAQCVAQGDFHLSNSSHNDQNLQRQENHQPKMQYQNLSQTDSITRINNLLKCPTTASATTITTDINSAVKIISAASRQCTQITTSSGQTTKAFIIDGSQLSDALALLQSMNPNVQVTQQQFVLLPGSDKGQMRLQNISTHPMPASVNDVSPVISTNSIIDSFITNSISANGGCINRNNLSSSPCIQTSAYDNQSPLVISNASQVMRQQQHQQPIHHHQQPLQHQQHIFNQKSHISVQPHILPKISGFAINPTTMPHMQQHLTNISTNDQILMATGNNATSQTQHHHQFLNTPQTCMVMLPKAQAVNNLAQYNHPIAIAHHNSPQTSTLQYFHNNNNNTSKLPLPVQNQNISFSSTNKPTITTIPPPSNISPTSNGQQ